MKLIGTILLGLLVFGVAFFAFSLSYALPKLLVIGIIIAGIVVVWRRRNTATTKN